MKITYFPLSARKITASTRLRGGMNKNIYFSQSQLDEGKPNNNRSKLSYFSSRRRMLKCRNVDSEPALKLRTIRLEIKLCIPLHDRPRLFATESTSIKFHVQLEVTNASVFVAFAYRENSIAQRRTGVCKL